MSFHLTESDARENLNSISEVNNFTNTIANQQSIYVRLENNTTGCYSTSLAFDLIVLPRPIINNLSDLELCDDDSDGSASNGILQNIDLESLIPEILNNQDPSTFQVSFHQSETNAANGVNPIISPFTNTTAFQQTIYVRLENTSTSCFETDSFNIIINTEPEVQSIPNIEFCDDDSDGIVSNIPLSDYISAILGSLDPNNYEVTFHETSSDANEGLNPLNSPYTNSEPNQQEVYIRVVNLSTGCTHTKSSFIIDILPLPTISNAPNIELCDDDNDGFVSGFNLEHRSSFLIGSQVASDFSLSYHLSEADAENNLNPITETENFTNTIANQQSIYVRLENNSTGCYSISLAFDLIVLPRPIINSLSNLELCDDDSDGSASNGILQNIDLEALIPEILGNQDPSTFQVSFHQSETDATTGINPIISPFSNTIAFQQSIYIRLENTSTSCFETDSFDIVINTEPEVQVIPNIELCDDDSDGIVSNIPLSDYITTILGSLDPNNFEVTFHETSSDAVEGTNALVSPYTNTIPNQQEIFVRVTNNTTGCVNTSASFMIVVLPQPIVVNPPNLELCDDDSDGIMSGFNINGQLSIILGNLNPNTYPVSFHLSQSDADLGINPISDLDNFQNTVPNQQTIYVRVENLNTSCTNNSISFDLIVNPIPEINIPEDLIACDNNSDGISDNIDLEILSDQILGNQDPDVFVVTYHISQSDSESGANPISSPFQNTVAFSQTIYIRVQNQIIGCYNANGNFDILVNPAPVIFPVDNIKICDNEEDGDDTNGFVQNIDLASQVSSILGPDQDPDNFQVSFHESLDEAQLGENSLSSPYSNNNPNSQTIYVRVENTNSGCTSIARSFSVNITSPPQFNVITPQFICVGEDTLELRVENPSGTYDYFWIDASGNTVLGETLTVTQGGTYSITATNVDGSGCSKTKEIEVNQSSIPVLTEEHVIINDGDQNSSILINNNPGVLGIGEYEFALLDSDGFFVYEYQDEPFFGNLRGGIYIILVRDKNGCGRAELEVAVLEIPKFFTPNNDGVNDLWNLKGITTEFKDYFPASKISVFDRFGKFIADFSIEEPGWNGRYNGQVVISNDYWYSITLIDRNGRTREVKGNMSLLRRK